MVEKQQLVVAAVVGAAACVALAVWANRKRAPQKSNKSKQLKAKKKSSYALHWEKEKQAAAACGDVVDIEDLVGTSIIPLTLQEMARDGVKPYAAADKEAKVQELEKKKSIPNFMATVRKNQQTLDRAQTTVLQLVTGLYCNQACSHCHVDSSPNRKEMMSHEVAAKCVEIAKRSPSLRSVDLTGGAPEMNREFRYLVREFHKLGLEIIDRCNLTVLLEPTEADLAQFLADHKVRVIASLPCYLEKNVASQRGSQIFERSIKGLQILNDLGYGKENTGLFLDLVYNPTGVHLPPPKEKLEKDYKRVLGEEYGISFNSLHCITNMPINRFFDHLKKNGDLDRYMDILVGNFNPSTCDSLMCRNYLSIDPFGRIFDCDFNQQIDLFLPGLGGSTEKPLDVFQIACTDDVLPVKVRTKKHCFGCTAGAGSS